MLTLFTTPKSFRGHTEVIQRNALKSWTLLPGCEVLVIGDEEGAACVSRELGLRHVSEVPRNEFGMPLIKGLFGVAAAHSTKPLLCYANADMLLMSDLVEAVERTAAQRERFLLLGQRYDAEVTELLSFDPGWQEALRSRVVRDGGEIGFGMDYFVFPKGLWGDVPETLAVGRGGWDNWPVYEARLRKAVVVDATQAVMAVHQRHDYAHHPQGQAGVRAGLEARRNYDTLGVRNVFNVLDATHVLAGGELRVRCRSCYPMCVCKPASF